MRVLVSHKYSGIAGSRSNVKKDGSCTDNGVRKPLEIIPNSAVTTRRTSFGIGDRWK